MTTHLFMRLNNDFFILPLISGLLFACTLPPLGLSIFVWIGFVPLYLFISNKRLSNKKVFQAGLIAGLVYFTVAVYPLLSLKAWWWLQIGSVVDANRYIFLFWLLYVVVLIAASFWGLFALLFRKLLSQRIFTILFLPFVWILFEYVRARIFLGFTWGDIGYVLHNDIPIIQLAHQFGVYGISFVIILVNILVFFVIYDINQKQIFKNGLRIALQKIIRIPYIYVAIGVILSIHLYGFIILQQTINTFNYNNTRSLSFSILQPGNESESTTITKLTYLLKEKPDIIILPESSFPSIIINEKLISSIHKNSSNKLYSPELLKIFSLSRKYASTAIVIGIDSIKNKNHYSSMFVFYGGKITSIYHKSILMPFSERSVSWSFLKPINPLASGDSNHYVLIKKLRASALICSELLFPKYLRDSTTSFVVVVGNDNVFNNYIVSEQNNINAQFDAVIARKYVVIAMKTGISGIIDPTGRQILHSRIGNSPQILTKTILLPQ